jgi:outer membrane biogenesis lipoprotein LolB
MKRWLAPVAAALALAACATLPVGTDGLSYDARRHLLEGIDAWEIRGRLAVDTGQRGFQGSFDWQQEADSLDLSVRGPLGAGVLQVVGTPSSMMFTARGETRTLTDPEPELSALLGFTDPGFRASIANGTGGTLAGFEQRLWRISFPTYQLAMLAGDGNGVLIPRRIDLAHGDLKLRLTIDDWRPKTVRAAP